MAPPVLAVPPTAPGVKVVPVVPNPAPNDAPLLPNPLLFPNPDDPREEDSNEEELDSTVTPRFTPLAPAPKLLLLKPEDPDSKVPETPNPWEP